MKFVMWIFIGMIGLRSQDLGGELVGLVNCNLAYAHISPFCVDYFPL